MIWPTWARLGPKHWALVVGGLAIVGGGAAYALKAEERLDARGGGFLRDGEIGFIVTRFEFAAGDDAQSGACPSGLSKSVAEIFKQSPDGAKRAGEDDESYSERIEAGGKLLSQSADGRNYCMHPEIAPFDTSARTLVTADARADGLNLDGKISRSAADIAAGRHDFVGRDGTKGVDNQFWRAVGCNASFQQGGQSFGFDTEMYTGSWGVVMTIGDVDDMKSDEDVTVGLHANADPIQLSPSRKALDYATYAMDQDHRFRASTKGRLVNGVLTTDPFDMRIRKVTNGMYLERELRDARIRATLSANGELKGTLGGYAPVASIYDMQFGFRQGKDADGKLMDERRRMGTANGAARVLGHTCAGIWQSLNRLADGHPDPKTGKFTSISMQYHFTARPAFIVDYDTRSAQRTDAAKAKAAMRVKP